MPTAHITAATYTGSAANGNGGTALNTATSARTCVAASNAAHPAITIDCTHEAAAWCRIAANTRPFAHAIASGTPHDSSTKAESRWSSRTAMSKPKDATARMRETLTNVAPIHFKTHTRTPCIFGYRLRRPRTIAAIVIAITTTAVPGLGAASMLPTSRHACASAASAMRSAGLLSSSINTATIGSANARTSGCSAANAPLAVTPIITIATHRARMTDRLSTPTTRRVLLQGNRRPREMRLTHHTSLFP